MQKEIIQIKDYLNEIFLRFTNLEEFNITEVPIPEELEHNGEEDWFNHADLKNLLKDLENKNPNDLKKILNVMKIALEIYSDWHCEEIYDYDKQLPSEFKEAYAEEENKYYMYSSSGAIEKWIDNNL